MEVILEINWGLLCQRSEYFAALDHYDRKGACQTRTPKQLSSVSECTFPCPWGRPKYFRHYVVAVQILTDDQTLKRVKNSAMDIQIDLRELHLDADIFLKVTTYLASDYLLNLYIAGLNVTNCTRTLMTSMSLWGENNLVKEYVLYYMEESMGISKDHVIELIATEGENDSSNPHYVCSHLETLVRKQIQKIKWFWKDHRSPGHNWCIFCLEDIQILSPHEGKYKQVSKMRCCCHLAHPACLDKMLAKKETSRICAWCGSRYSKHGVLWIEKRPPRWTGIRRINFTKLNFIPG